MPLSRQAGSPTEIPTPKNLGDEAGLAIVYAIGIHGEQQEA
jgi:hypothetical protein